MEKEDKHSLLQPLITPIFNPSSSSSYSHENIDHQNNNYEHNIILRILFLLFVALISIWANYEASKTFDINIINDTKDSPAGRRFTLFYISNDKATRILFNTSSFVQNLLYPNNNNKKNIESITLRLASRNLNNSIVVATTITTTTVVEKSFNRYVIEISPMLLEDENFDEIAIVGAIQRAMALIWIWDGGSTAPLGLLNGMAEYVVQLAGFRRERLSGCGGKLPECESCGGDGKWWEDKDSRHVACLLSYCENYKEGFIRRLNEAMKDTWHDRMVDDVLGMKAGQQALWIV